jgi:syringomycin synthetase protein SyrE
LAGDDHVLVLTSHHIVTDGWSVGIVSADLSAAYRRACAGGVDGGVPVGAGQDVLLGLSPLPIQPADHAHWQRENRERLDAGLGYWTRQLADLPTLALPADRTRPAAPTGAGAGVSGTIAAEVAGRVSALATALQVSPLAVLLAGFSVVLHRYSGQPDLPIGSVFSGRTRTELEPLVGYFANTLVLRTRLDNASTTTVAEHIHNCHNTILQAMQYQDTPFTLLVDTLQPPRTPGQNPLFQTALSLLPTALWGTLSFEDVMVTSVSLGSNRSRFDLSVQVAPQADGSMQVATEYASELFDASRIERLMAHFTRALSEMVADPSRPLERILELTEAEQSLVSGPVTSAMTQAPGRQAASSSAASSETLRTVLDILTELLAPAEPLRPDEDFFTQGGNSLVLTRLTLAIQDRCGVRVLARDLYRAPSLEAMAALVDERAGQSATADATPAALVTLRAGGSRPPIFLVHAIGGSVVPYLPLAELLGSQQPVYAFEAPGLHEPDGRQEPRPSTIAGLAADYLTELRTVQPSGPYRLAGWSLGGMVAQQMAVALRSAGDEVALLALLDAVPSDVGAQVPDLAGLISWFAHDLTSIGGQRLSLDQDLLRTLPDAEQLPRALDHLVAQGIVDQEDRGTLATRFAVFTELVTAFLKHRPAPLDRPTELLVAADGAIDPVRRWQAVGGELHVHRVAGDHYTMLQPPQLPPLAALLSQLLEMAH